MVKIFNFRLDDYKKFFELKNKNNKLAYYKMFIYY